MIWTRVRARWSPFFILATVTTVFAVGPMPAQSKPATYEGKAVRIGHGTAHTVVRTDANGKPDAKPGAYPSAYSASVLISRRNRLTSAHNDRVTMFRTGRLGRAIQVEEPA